MRKSPSSRATCAACTKVRRSGASQQCAHRYCSRLTPRKSVWYRTPKKKESEARRGQRRTTSQFKRARKNRSIRTLSRRLHKMSRAHCTLKAATAHAINKQACCRPPPMSE
eukprot:1990287-Pleurochrysis_carterae.AAC.1